MRARRVVGCLGGLVLGISGAGAAGAQNSALTAYATYRDGGNFTDTYTNTTLSMEAAGGFAASFDWRTVGTNTLQVFFSQQQSRLSVPPANGTAGPGTVLPMRISYLHFGGMVAIAEETSRGGAYVVGGLGATVMEPGINGLSTALRPSLNLGIGYQLPLGNRLALRFEARGYATLVNSSGALFCSGGCAFSLSGTGVYQGEVLGGLSFDF